MIVFSGVLVYFEILTNCKFTLISFRDDPDKMVSSAIENLLERARNFVEEQNRNLLQANQIATIEAVPSGQENYASSN